MSRFFIDVEHKGLAKFKRISGTDEYVVEQRARAQREAWDQQWRVQQERNNAASILRDGKSESVRRTEAAQREIAAITTILANGLRSARVLEGSIWHSLRNNNSFVERPPGVPSPYPIPPEPNRYDPSFAIQESFLAMLIPSIRRKREKAAEALFNAAHEEWVAEVNKLVTKQQADQNYYQHVYADWQRRKSEFEANQRDQNLKADGVRERYVQKDREAVLAYLDILLSQSAYPETFPKEWEIDIAMVTEVLIIDYELPHLDSMPKLKAVKYVQSRNVLEESTLRESELSQLYDAAMYQTCLRTMHEIFESDGCDAIKSVTFNGWVNFTDKATGNPARSCIMSVQSTKSTFKEINLSAVEPKACFRSLKGVGSAKLAGMAAVVPILRLNKNDPRFVPAHDAISDVAETTNVAAISWEEFEFLVRDLFEKEFSSNGGEVKITRASRDHGVDAIAFDPDPIRGGKIVIQAKRYTNVVGVSAVRDLYGTLMNEGANRGILVTTSQYGPDSYEFAKNKPITLLDGGNLLSLLERHGHRARIDLAEAKKLGVSRDEK